MPSPNKHCFVLYQEHYRSHESADLMGIRFLGVYSGTMLGKKKATAVASAQAKAYAERMGSRYKEYVNLTSRGESRYWTDTLSGMSPLIEHLVWVVREVKYNPKDWEVI